MTDIPDHIMDQARCDVSAWLDEFEGYAIRRERVPAEALPWIETAWALSAMQERVACARLAASFERKIGAAIAELRALADPPRT